MSVVHRGLILAGCLALAGCSKAVEEPPAPRSPLYTNLGNHHHPITTSSPDAQRYFDQGLTLSYAFNHGEAIRAFRQAAAIDPACAMCYWGVAFAYGPNINAPITEDAAREAWQAIEEARKRMDGASERERGYIAALALRYAADPTAERAPLDQKYAQAMGQLAKKFPDDLDAATLYAQSLMDTSPWNYWEKDGTPRLFTRQVLAALESVLARKADHIGAIHLYIHAVEASDNPGRAEAYADTLAALVPGAGHLVHMPAHVYLRVGRYADATAANEHAVKADEAYLAGDVAPGNMTYEMGYYPHNIHFIATSAAMEGRRTRALDAAIATREKSHPDMWRDAMMGGMMQHFALTPIYTMVRFGMWDEILAEPMPAEDLPFMRAIAHMARGLAYASTARLPDAEKELAALTPLRSEASLPNTWVSSVNVASDIVAIAHEVLQGEIAARRRRAAVAARHFAQAVALESALTYMEPPDWPVPTRHLQGVALLGLGLPAEAEVAFRGDLQKFPDNGWSLSGLEQSLSQQGKAAEAAEMKARLARAWAGADTTVVGGRVQLATR